MNWKIALIIAWAGCVGAGRTAGDEVSGENDKLLDPRSILADWRDEMAKEPAEEESRPDTLSAESALVRQLTIEGSRLVGSGQLAEGLGKYREALRLEPHSMTARFGLATAFHRMERYAEAAEIYEKLIEELPEDYNAKNNLAWLLATRTDVAARDPKRAEELAQEALLLAVDDYRVWSTLAEAHYAAGHYDRAERAAIEALRLAIKAGVRGTRLDEYREQARKSQQAAGTLSVAE